MNTAKLKTILEKHQHWINKDCYGWEKMKANLSGANLSGVDLYEANLSGANLSGADLSGADLYEADLSEANLYRAILFGANLYRAILSGANLSEADLSGADLYEADLSEANLSGANLSEANLSGADLYEVDLSEANLYRAILSGANLSGVDLYEANLSGANLSGVNLSGADIEPLAKLYPLCCPEYGAFIAWKRANNMIIKLKIPEDAKRSSAFGRKCRASKAMCLAIENMDGTQSGVKAIPSDHDSSFIYKVGEMMEVNNFDDNRLHECAPGIHFFITRREAVDYR